jgi:hypothetical protein
LLILQLNININLITTKSEVRKEVEEVEEVKQV